MTTKHRSLATLAAVFATALGGAAFAQGNQAPAPQPPAPQQAPTTGQGMMQGRGMMGQGNMMGGQTNTTAEMNKMMEGCNAMMQRAMQAPPANSAAPQQKG